MNCLIYVLECLTIIINMSQTKNQEPKDYQLGIFCFLLSFHFVSVIIIVRLHEILDKKWLPCSHANLLY